MKKIVAFLVFTLVFNTNTLAQSDLNPKPQGDLNPNSENQPQCGPGWGRRFGGGGGQCMRQGRHLMSHIRHQYVMKNGLDESYRGKTNPLSANPKVLKKGAQQYQILCARCHGIKGYGDGKEGKNLNPQPSHLAMLMKRRRMATDDYLYWTIAEGGILLKTTMPAFKESLTTEEIWQIILYLRQLN